YISLKDSLDNEHNSKIMADMLVKYEADKKQNTIKSLKQQQLIREKETKVKTQQRNGIIAGLVLMLLISSLLFINYRQRMRAKNTLNIQKIDELLKNQEIKSFESMIEG